MIEFLFGFLFGIILILILIIFLFYFLFLSPYGGVAKKYSLLHPTKGITFEEEEDLKKTENNKSEKIISEHFTVNKESTCWLNSILDLIYTSQLKNIKLIMKEKIESSLNQFHKYPIVPTKLRMVKKKKKKKKKFLTVKKKN